ncbi:uncharacterized protein [Miscanthus floridulus]|uniref:uncharacterized protein n=1 Tax=Miscanthus floridulus TaxID=154761 RepID=UPI00345A2693
MLKKPCPYHQGLVRHALEDWTKLRHYYAKLGLLDDDAKKRCAGDQDDDKDEGFPEPCYAKFMAVPNYTYLKLKMTGPHGVITIESTYEHAYNYDVECIEYAKALMEAEALIVDLDRLGSQLPEPKHRAETFELAEAIKLVPVDPACPDDRALRISATLDIK